MKPETAPPLARSAPSHIAQVIQHCVFLLSALSITALLTYLKVVDPRWFIAMILVMGGWLPLSQLLRWTQSLQVRWPTPQGATEAATPPPEHPEPDDTCQGAETPRERYGLPLGAPCRGAPLRATDGALCAGRASGRRRACASAARLCRTYCTLGPRDGAPCHARRPVQP
ncbi:MAG: hypothetical protein JNK72_15170 [Myxococcales bacterium]|nr:hypothetical protein [Myxococcales bacterium]